ncbi:MAG: 2-polyprenyl-6-methoxyphenol hydroxylase-like FAD-dependent oxidoreductase [Crocinitomicaceae bacterium]
MNITETSKGDVIVIGGSIAGLMSAAALSPYCAKVILVDNDSFNCPGTVRKSTPQGLHVHGLLSSGWTAMKTLLPGVELRLREQGAEWVHFGKEFRWHHFGRYKASFEDLMEGPFMSRTCLEDALRAEVTALGNVEFLSDSVTGFIGDNSTLSGVKLASGEQYGADTVVDASGRSSRCTHWLEEIGAATPRVDTLAAGLRYTSCRFKPAAKNHDQPWKALFVTPKPPKTVSGALFPQEDGSWLVTLAGRKKDTMPLNQEEFIEYSKKLCCPDVFQAIQHAEPLSELTHYRFKESKRYYYEEVQMPNNLLVVGDSVCSFNPIFGQGMTVCTLQALKISELLASGRCDSENYFKSISGLVNHAWNMVTVEDMRHPDLHDQRSLKVKLMQQLTQRVYDKTSEDGELNKMLYEVIHFQRPATDLCSPWALIRLL